MIKQNQIKRTLELPDSIAVVRGILSRSEHASRSALADAVFEVWAFSTAAAPHRSQAQTS